jgi:putative ABC transport system ATP-binding protein
MPVLEAKDIHRKYQLGAQNVKALSGVDFLVEKGEFVAIMGPSGSGKSTLLHLLGGLDKPSQGEITLAGMQLSILNDRQITLTRRHHVGFIFQFYNLVPILSAEENILLPLIIDGKDPRKYQDRLDRMLDLVGLRERRKHRPEQLSGGEQQRVAVARALMTEPAIVLADEPTGNLDSKSGTAIMELLHRSCKELFQTIIIVTHDPRAARFADRVVFLRDGVIVSELAQKDLDMTQRLRQIVSEVEISDN